MLLLLLFPLTTVELLAVDSFSLLEEFDMVLLDLALVGLGLGLGVERGEVTEVVLLLLLGGGGDGGLAGGGGLEGRVCGGVVVVPLLVPLLE